MISRRRFLQALGIAAAAAALPQAPMVHELRNIEPPPVWPAEIGPHDFLVSFPDGTTWGFRGYITSERWIGPEIEPRLETLKAVTIRPTGPQTINHDGALARLNPTTRLLVNGQDVGDLNEVSCRDSLETFDATDHQDPDLHWVGVRRKGEFSFEVQFVPESNA